MKIKTETQPKVKTEIKFFQPPCPPEKRCLYPSQKRWRPKNRETTVFMVINPYLTLGSPRFLALVGAYSEAACDSYKRRTMRFFFLPGKNIPLVFKPSTIYVSRPLDAALQLFSCKKSHYATDLRLWSQKWAVRKGETRIVAVSNFYGHPLRRGI